MNNNELTEYLSRGIDNLISKAIKSTIKNPKETAFLMNYSYSNLKAKKLRKSYDEKGIHVPTFLIASIASSCNLFCKGCYARENNICGEGSDNKSMSDERFGELFKEAKEIGISFILLAGGEPLIKREIIESAAKIKDIIFPIFTNGTMLDDYYIGLFDKNRNLIPIISIEGDSEKTDERRGEGTFEIIQTALSRLKKINTMFGVSITVTKENYQQVSSDEFIKSVSDYGCRVVLFIEYVPVSKNTEHLAPSEAEREYLEQRQRELRIKYKDMIFLSFPGDEKYTGGCLAAGRGFFHINSNGNAEPCPFSPYSDCNLKDAHLIEALSSPLFKKLKEMELVGGEHDGGCSLFAKEAEVKKLVESK